MANSKFLGTAQRNIEQLKRFQVFELQIARLLGGWLPGMDRWEVKHTVGLHIWENAEISKDLRTRLWELRVMNPDRGSEAIILPVFAELSRAQHDYELLAALYLVLKQDLVRAYQEMAEETYDVYDYPTIPILRKIIPMAEAQIAWARQTLDSLTDTGEKKRNMARFVRFARDLLASIGGVTGDEIADESVSRTPPPAYATLLPFAEAHRDERFDIQVNLPPMPAPSDPEWTVWQFMGYATEMQAAETLATCLWEVEGMPWEFYYDVARHCWDEVRHSQLGCRRLEQLGHHVTDFPHSVGSYAWRQLYDPVIRYCALTYVIEAGSFELKHDSYQRYVEAGDMESAQAIMYDIVDETMHVRWGTKWVGPLMKHYQYEMTLDELVDHCRAIVVKNTVSPAQKIGAERDIARKQQTAEQV